MRLIRMIQMAVTAFFFLLAVLAFCDVRGAAVIMKHLLGDGVLLSLFANFTLLALLTLAAIFLITFISGRFYCSLICPLGILQQIIFFITSQFRRGEKQKDHRQVRWLILTGGLIALITGYAAAWRWLSPYSLFGMITTVLAHAPLLKLHNYCYPNYPIPMSDFSGFWLSGLTTLAVLIILVVWRGRFFCTTLCPFGAILNAIAKFSWLRLQINSDRCRGCANCVAKCSAGCIDIANKKIAGDRCLRCLNCVAWCKLSAIKLTRATAEKSTGVLAVQPARRALGYVAAVAVIGGVLRFFDRRYQWNLPPESQKFPKEKSVLPPGAGSEQRLFAKCTQCHLCVVQCVGRVIKPADKTHRTLHLEFSHAMCEFNCHRCGVICPTGAILPMSLPAKQRWKIGNVDFNPEACIAVQQHTACGACAEHCPTRGVEMVEINGLLVPKTNPEFCIGCGACEYACPAAPQKAIFSRPIMVQVQALVAESTPQASTIDGDWLL